VSDKAKTEGAFSSIRAKGLKSMSGQNANAQNNNNSRYNRKHLVNIVLIPSCNGFFAAQSK
jgi:hypothetical protein